MKTTWKRNASLHSCFESADPLCMAPFFRELAQSRWADSFVLCGSFLLDALLPSRARKPQSMTLISRIAPDDARIALETIAASALLPISADFDGITLDVLFDRALPTRPQRRTIAGVSLLCVSPEYQVAEAALALMAGVTKENAPYLYDIASLSLAYDLDGRTLYESLAENLPRVPELLNDECSRFLKADWLVKCIYEHAMHAEGLTALDYFASLQICTDLLFELYTDVRNEREFFGHWIATQGKWSDYRLAVEA